MKIFLHIGYHKTGSSFLQMMLSQNREYLLENKIYYPIAERDKDAKRGGISPGNGLKLSQAISKNNNEEFVECFLMWIEEAAKRGCDKLLISSEGLFHSLASSEYVKLFDMLKDHTKITEINGLLFIRDPYDHILSLYKHRGKRGTIEDFQTWTENEYETLDLSMSFLNRIHEDTINWMFRKYKNNSQFMADCLFLDWLKIKTPGIPQNDRVNTSLTLSEILVLKIVNKTYGRDTVLALQSEFSNLDEENKASDGLLEIYYRRQLENWFLIKDKSIEEISKLLPEDEKLQIFTPVNSEQNFEVITLTANQLNKLISIRKTQRGILEKIYTKLSARVAAFDK